MSKKKTIKDAQEIAFARKGKCLSDKYINCKTKMLWCCKNNHTWHAIFDNIFQGTWCPQCANNIQYTIDEVKNKISQFGYKLVSHEYINNRTPIKVICKNGHKCDMRLDDIINSNQDCPDCSKNKLRERFAFSIGFVKNDIDRRGGKLLSTKYINARTPIKIQCLRCKNIWNNRFDNIRNGQWCPTCNTGKSQKLLLQILRQLFPNYKIENNYKKFKWLKNDKTGYNLEIDIFISNVDKSFTLAVEYDGEQHFRPIRFGGISNKVAKENFTKQKLRDEIKNMLVLSHKNEIKYFIRLSFQDSLNIDNIKNKLIEKNII